MVKFATHKEKTANAIICCFKSNTLWLVYSLLLAVSCCFNYHVLQLTERRAATEEPTIKQTSIDQVANTIAAGLTINDSNINDPSSNDDDGMTFNPAEITHVYRLGHIRPLGRSNNQIISILHAVDTALDRHGDPPNNRAVVAISKWAFHILKGLFFDGKNSTEFALDLEQLRPVLLVHAGRLEELGLTESHNKTTIWLRTQHAYYYQHKGEHNLTSQIIERRRHQLWGQLFQYGVAERNLGLYNGLKDTIEKRGLVYGDSKTMEYVTIHSRWLEGECEKRVGKLLPWKDECLMTPSYIKAIMGDTIDKPIVFIGDGQKKEVLEKLKKDPDIGPALIVPEEDIVLPDGVKVSQPFSDMMLAIMGDVFIGTRASTFATMVGVSRVVRGADPASNYIYTRQHNSSIAVRNREKQMDIVEVCEKCLFFCDKIQSNFCGEEVIFS